MEELDDHVGNTGMDSDVVSSVDAGTRSAQGYSTF